MVCVYLMFFASYIFSSYLSGVFLFSFKWSLFLDFLGQIECIHRKFPISNSIIKDFGIYWKLFEQNRFSAVQICNFSYHLCNFIENQKICEYEIWHSCNASTIKLYLAFI